MIMWYRIGKYKYREYVERGRQMYSWDYETDYKGRAKSRVCEDDDLNSENYWQQRSEAEKEWMRNLESLEERGRKQNKNIGQAG